MSSQNKRGQERHQPPRIQNNQGLRKQQYEEDKEDAGQIQYMGNRQRESQPKERIRQDPMQSINYQSDSSDTYQVQSSRKGSRPISKQSSRRFEQQQQVIEEPQSQPSRRSPPQNVVQSEEEKIQANHIPSQRGAQQQSVDSESSSYESINSDMDPEEVMKRFGFASADDEDQQFEDNDPREELKQAQNESGDQKSEASNCSFKEFYDKQSDSNDSEDHSNLHSKRSNKNFIPLDFAKQHIQKIEQDRIMIHERHVKIMREMDENYKLIEKENQEYYIEFLQKWKEVARCKITSYRRTINQLENEKKQIESVLAVKENDIEHLNDKLTQAKRDKEKILYELNETQKQAENDKLQMESQMKDKLRKKDKEIKSWKDKCEDKDSIISQLENKISNLKRQQEQDQQRHEEALDKLSRDNEDMINDLRSKLKQKRDTNIDLEKEISELKKTVTKLETQLQQQSQQLAGQNQSMLSSSGGSNQPIRLRGFSQIGGVRPNLLQKLQAQSEGRNAQAQQQTSGNEQQPQNLVLKVKSIKRDLIKIPANSIVIQRPDNNSNNQSFVQSSSKIINNIQNYSTQPSQHMDNKQEEEKKMAGEENQKQQQLQSERSSKSLSPRRQAVLRQQEKKAQQEQVAPQTSTQKTHAQLLEENRKLKKEILKYQELLKQQASQQPTNREGQQPKVSEQVSHSDSNGAIAKLTQENAHLKEQAQKLGRHLKQSMLEQKKLQAIIGQLKSNQSNVESSQLNVTQQEDNSNSFIQHNNSAQVNQSRLTDMSQLYVNQSMMDPQEEQMMKEKIRAEVTMEMEKKLIAQDQSYKMGTQKREQAINRLKLEKEKLKQSFEVKERELTQQMQDLEAQNQKLKTQLVKQSEDLKLGEQCFQNEAKQVQELQKQLERIYQKYENEILKRKQLHNQIEDMKGKIRVFVRIRPMNDQDRQFNRIEAVKVMDQLTLKIQDKKDGGDLTEQEYFFDSCFGPHATQEQVFEDTKMLIQSAIDGYNACIFAYGQTGSGKTYTMQGTPENPGIVPRALQELFNLKQKYEKDQHFSINIDCYMVELYMDKLIDLMQQKSIPSAQLPKLNIIEDSISGQVYIQNVVTKRLNSKENATQIYERGIKARRIAKTGMNDESSRSHFIFTVIVETKNNETGQKYRSKLSFVDLAGSEKANKSNANNNLQRQKEGCAINSSLHVLGKVISELQNGNDKAFISYRDNKLTFLMKDSLGGNSKTLMFVNISQTDYNIQETQMSISYGQRVRAIKNEVRQNTESQEMQQLKQNYRKLEEELEKVKLQTQRQNQAFVTTTSTAQGVQK